MVLGSGIDGRELGGEALDGALGVHDLRDRDAGKIELHGERFREQAGIAPGDAGPAAGADLDLDHALGFQRAQRIAGHDAADPETLGQILFGAEEIARTKLASEQRVAHLGGDLGRHGGGAEGDDLALATIHRRVQPHARVSQRNVQQAAEDLAGRGQKVATIIKMISFLGRPVNRPGPLFCSGPIS